MSKRTIVTMPGDGIGNDVMDAAKIVLDKIDAVNRTTNRLIAQTASQLRTQGAAIHKQASSTQLDMETLKRAFVDLDAALDDIA